MCIRDRGKPFEQALEIELPDQDEANPQIDRMWAWYQVQGLLNQKRASGETEALKNKIVSLCEEFSIVSQYASFIVLENDAEYRRWKIERRNAGRIENDRAARAKVQRELAKLREESMTKLGPVKSQPSQPQNKVQEPDLGSNNFQAPSTNDSSRDLVFGDSSNVSHERSSGDGGGGGAIDPITGLIAASMAGAAALRRRRKGNADSELAEPPQSDLA